jgi:hypothetical protein
MVDWKQRNALMPVSMLNPPDNPLLAYAPTPKDAWESAQAAGSRAWEAAQNPQTWVDAANAYSGALIGGTSRPTAIAGYIAKYAKNLGYEAVLDASKLSKSQYISLSHEQLPNETLKIRISDHDLPPSYGPPGDYDVHSSNPRQESLAWYEVVKNLSDRLGVPLPRQVQAVATRASNVELNQAETLAVQKAEQAARRAAQPQSAVEYQRKLLETFYPSEWAEIHKYGDANVNSKRAQLAARYEADHPGEIQWVRSISPFGN